MQPRAARRPGALPQPQVDRQRISPSAINLAKTRDYARTKRKGERDNGKRPEDGGTTCYTHCPTLFGILHPSPKTAKFIECIPRTLALEAYSAPPHECPHWATKGSPYELLGLLRSLHGGGVRSLSMAPTLSSNSYTLWQLPTERT